MAPGRALLVEDDVGVADVVRDLLVGQGLEVEATPSGLEGLVRAARDDSFALALVDLDVQELSGLGVTRAIRDFSRLPLIAMSGREGPWCREALAAGASACVAKPFDPHALALVVDATVKVRVLARPWPGDVRALSEHELERVASLSPADLDALPFGAIRVDAGGTITSFNAYEQRLAGLDPETVIGRRFVDVAPCTQVREFVSAVDEGRARGSLDRVLRFVFPRRGVPCLVSVRLFLDAPSRQLWLFVSQLPPGETIPP